MTAASPAAIVFGAFILLVTVELLRRRSLREKYAALWLTVSVVVVVFAIYPGALVGVSRLLGFTVPANLLFFVGGVVLTVISMQLSLEAGRLEDESQRLAEEVALLRLEVRRLAERASAEVDAPAEVGTSVQVDAPAEVEADVEPHADGGRTSDTTAGPSRSGGRDRR